MLPTDHGVIVIGVMLNEPPPPCDLCGGTGWASFTDPFLDGDLLEAACPCAHPATRGGS